MAIFERFLGKNKLDPSEDQGKLQSRQEESRGDALNQGPQEPVLPDRDALEREAGELFVLKQKQPTTASAEAKSHAEEKTSYTGDAEIKGLSLQETAMTKARSDVLDLLAKIERAGLPVSEKLRDAVKNELVNLASEAARIEFQEAERADPVVILRNILEELEKKQTIGSIKDDVQAALRDIEKQTKEVVRDFQTAKETLIQQGVVDPLDNVILSRISGFKPLDLQERVLAQVSFYNPSIAIREACVAELLKELGVFAAGASLSLGDLFTAIKETGRTTIAQGRPYYDRANLRIVGLSSTRPELKGLNVIVDAGGNNNQISVRLFGDSSFFLRVIKSAGNL